jgi:hypothetical protein
MAKRCTWPDCGCPDGTYDPSCERVAHLYEKEPDDEQLRRTALYEQTGAKGFATAGIGLTGWALVVGLFAAWRMVGL